jgi:hypothetical protein
VRFVGYWKPECPVKTATADCLASLHRTDDRALVWIVNTARQERTAVVAVDWKALGLDLPRIQAFNAETGETVQINYGGFTVPVPRRDFTAVLLIERRQLDLGQSLVASFDHGSDADQAIGCEVFVGDGQLVASDRGRALALGEKGVQLWSHLNFRDTIGSLAFRARLAKDKYGVLLRTDAARVGRDTPPPAPPIVIEIKKTKDGDQLVLRIDAKVDKDAPPPPEISTIMPMAAGWHEFGLSWKDKRLSLVVDGNPAGTIPIESLNIPSTTGPQILGMAKFVFGGRGPVEAIDDVRAWRGI